jgi:putative peptidoglycan lipid II flippase
MSELAINQRWDAFRERLSTGIRATVFLVLPAAVGYLVLGEPIVRLLLQRGVMTARSVDLVADVLRFFVIGLVFFSVFQLFLRAFYALQDTKTPFLINIGAVAINLAVNVPLFAIMKTPGLAAGHALAYAFGVSVQAWVLSRRIGGLGVRVLLRSAARVAAAAAVMAAAVWPLSRVLEDRLAGSTPGDLAAVGIPVVVGAAVYLGAASVFRVEELRFVRNLVARRRSDG